MAVPASKVDDNANSATFAAVVTPSDTDNLAQIARGLWVGGAGNVNVDMAGDGGTVLFSGIPAGTLLPIRVQRVRSTSTTATLIVALY